MLRRPGRMYRFPRSFTSVTVRPSRILFEELRLAEYLELLRRVFLGGAGDFLDALAGRLEAALAKQRGRLTTAAVDEAVEDALDVRVCQQCPQRELFRLQYGTSILPPCTLALARRCQDAHMAPAFPQPLPTCWLGW